MSNRIFSISFIFILLSISVNAQDNKGCSEVLSKAQDTYKEGRISEIEDLLKSCLESGFTKPEKIEAYRLLTLTYLYFNEKEKATDAMAHMLRVDPEYKIRPVDPTEFVNLYNSFRTTPILLLGAKAGANFLDVDVVKNFSLDNSGVKRGEYKSGVGIQAAFFAQFPISKRFSVLTELTYSVKSYTYTDFLFDYASLEFPEKQSYLELPVLLNIRLGSNQKWVPYINLGGSFAYLLNAKAEPIRKDITGDNNQREIKEGEMDISSIRKDFNYNLILGTGIKVKDVIGRGYIFLDIRYCRGLNNLVKTEERYSNNDLIYKYLYLDNDFKINTFQYSLGYSYPLYKPKLKRVKKSKTE